VLDRVFHARSPRAASRFIGIRRCAMKWAMCLTACFMRGLHGQPAASSAFVDAR